MQKEAAPLLAQYKHGTHLPTAVDLAYAWRWHLGSSSAIQEAEAVAKITPAITDFLEWFEAAYLG